MFSDSLHVNVDQRETFSVEDKSNGFGDKKKKLKYPYNAIQ